MTEQELREKAASAQVAGTIAFKNNQKCIPCLDKNYEEISQGAAVGQGTKILKAWIKGWTLANINAVV